MPNDIFEDNNGFDPNRNYVEELVGEKNKYKDTNSLAYSNLHKDEFIEQLKAEQAQLREELATRLSLEQFYDQIKTVPQTIPQQPSEEDSTDTTAMKPQDIEQLVEAKLRQISNQSLQEKNTTEVTQKLQQVLGPNYAQKLRQEVQALGMTEQQAKQLAATNPKAFYRLIGIDNPTKADLFQAPPRSHSTSLPHSQGEGRGKSYYDELMKKDQLEYFSSKTQNEKFQRIKEIGLEAFNNS